MERHDGSIMMAAIWLFRVVSSAVDRVTDRLHVAVAAKIARERPALAGAEGATAPETLRQKDRATMATLESRPATIRCPVSPKR
jgi:hypothetical protein